MARVEYTWKRRISMQLVLCAALALTVALAWWISRSRSAGLEVKLGPAVRFSNNVLPLELRLPVGWKMDHTDADGEFAASESQTKQSQRRTLTIAVQRARQEDGSVPGPLEFAVEQMGGRPVAPPVVELEFLDNDGVIVQSPASLGRHTPPRLCAATVIGGTKPIAVTVTLKFSEARTLVQSDFELLGAVAESLARVEAPATKPAPATQKVVSE